MAVTNGQTANQTTFNNAFMSRTVNTSTVGVVELNNTSDPDSGSIITNSQRYQNEIADSDGTVGIGDATRKTYSSTTVVANGDNRKVAIGKIDAKFVGATGHAHSGADGDGALISGADLDDFNLFFSAWQTFTLTGAAGTTDDITTEMSGKTAGGGASALGVITSAPYNRVYISDSSTETFIEDLGGQRVYGRITESAGTWTLSYYTNEAGVETAHSLTSTNIRVHYREVFDQDTRPTIEEDTGAISTVDTPGGGGSSLQWVEDTDAPTVSVEHHNQIYSFEAGLGQDLYALVKVPENYVAGNQVFLRSQFYSGDSSGNVLMQTIATLIRAGTDQISSTTNQRTSTNSAVTLSAGTVDEPQNVDFDLSSSTGEINSVAISGGDLIIVQLTRGTDTATGDAKVPVWGSEVTFT